MLSPDTSREMMPMLLEFEPGSELAEYGRHRSGEEWVYVIEGRLRLSLEGSPPRYSSPVKAPTTRPHGLKGSATTTHGGTCG
jgi:quercetin dioxygenase-like cupin family protein